MKLIQIIRSLAVLSFFCVTATPADVASRTDRPISLLREAIPAGATIYGLDGSSNKIDDDGPSSEIAERDDYNCNGSTQCSSSEFGCSAASGAYDDHAWYCGYTSRVSGNCTATFACFYYDVCWAGWFLKEYFHRISSNCFISMTQCGSTFFDNGNCQTNYNYCSTCKNVS